MSLPDRLDRRAVVLASAGSGKTFRLVNTYIHLLADGAAPESILAATFTRKAAGEIRDRVFRELARAARDDTSLRKLQRFVPAVRSREHCAEMLGSLAKAPDRLGICTLDALLVRSAQTLAVALGFPGGVQILDDPGDTQLREQAAAATIDDAEPASIAALLYLAYATGAHAGRSVHASVMRTVRELHSVYTEIGGRPDPFDFPPPQNDGDQSNPNPVDWDAVVPVLTARLSEAPLPVKKRSGDPDQRFVKAVTDIASALNARAFEQLATMTLLKNAWTGDKNGEATFYRHAIPDELYSALLDLGAHLTRYFAGRTRLRNRASYALIDQFDGFYRRAKADSGVARFEDLAPMIASANPGDLADLFYRLDTTYTHILLDEFQDTSAAQMAFLEPLIDELVADTAERTLFVVGDAKQSLYQWRQARPTILRDLPKRKPQLSTYRMDTSFRTAQGLLDKINAVFTALPNVPVLTGSAAAAAFARDYEPHVSADSLRDAPYYIRLVGIDPDDGDRTKAELLATECADRCKRICDANPDATIGVLTRSNSNIPRILETLRSRGVAAGRVGGSPPTDHQAVNAVLAAFRFAENPTNTAARALASASIYGRAIGLDAPSETHNSHHEATALRQTIMQDTPSGFIYRIANDLADSIDTRGMKRLRQLADIADAYTAERRTWTIDGLVRAIEQSTVPDSALTNVQVMTVHQSKGLQFDAVILPDLDKSWSPRNNETLIAPVADEAGHAPEDVAPNAVSLPLKAELRAFVPEVQALHDRVADQHIAEELCVLYVALTRARYGLELIASPTPKRGYTGVSAAAVIAGAISDGGTIEAGTVAHEAGDPDWMESPALDVQRKTGAPDRPPTEIRLNISPMSPERTAALMAGAPSDRHTTGLTARFRAGDASRTQLGTVVHAALALRPETDPNTSIADSLDRVMQQLSSFAGGAGVVRADSIRDEALEILTAAMADAEIRALLATDPLIEVHTEFPIAAMAPDEGALGVRLVSGIIDRLHVRLDPTTLAPIEATIIDYKTDRGADAGLLAERHSGQVDAYRKAVAAAFCLPRHTVHGVLVGLSPPTVVRLEPLQA